MALPHYLQWYIRCLMVEPICNGVFCRLGYQWIYESFSGPSDNRSRGNSTWPKQPK